MKIILEASAENFTDLIKVASSNPSLAGLIKQIQSEMALHDHDPSAEVPKEGDDPIIERLE